MATNSNWGDGLIGVTLLVAAIGVPAIAAKQASQGADRPLDRTHGEAQPARLYTPPHADAGRDPREAGQPVDP